MKGKKILFYLVLVGFLLLPFHASASDPAQANGESVRIERLVRLCQLWGYVKYFHPSLAYRADLDWDATLVATIPKVRNARTAEEYGDALQGMLDVLGDSITHVAKTSSETNWRGDENEEFGYRVTDDAVLVVTVGDYFALSSPSSQQKLTAIAAEIPKARAIVFDLRSARPTGEFGKFQLAANFSQIARLLSSVALATPGDRMRVHYGFSSLSVFSSGQYRSGFFTQDGKRITPAQNAKDVPSVMVLNKHSGMLASMLALQATGKALVIFDGDTKDFSVGKATALDLGEGLLADVRVSEPVFADGTIVELQPDLVVRGARDQAVEAALRLARNFKPSTVLRKRTAGSAAPLSDRSYPEMKYPSIEYRLLAAFRIWNLFNYFFPYKHLMEDDWDVVLRQFVPKFELAKDELDYSLVVAEMITHVHDSHAYVSGSVINNSLFGSGFPPIRVRIIESMPVVTSVSDKSMGVEVGDVVLRVDGEEAKARLARYAKYISASTMQSKLDKASLYFLSGKEKSVVTLRVRDRFDKEKELKLNRQFEDFTTLYHRERSGDMIQLLDGNIGYADLDRLTMGMVDGMLEKFKNTKAIIFDMRGYPKRTVWSLAPRLSERQEVAAAFFETPLVGHNSPAKSFEAFYQTIPARPPGKWIYKGKTVMLIDERTMSQAEHTGLFLKAANGTTFIGSHTAGANGEIASFTVPGGMTIGFTGQSVKFPDGRQLQRIGLMPDVEVKPTIKGIREGRDEVLERAIQYLSNKRK